MDSETFPVAERVQAVPPWSSSYQTHAWHELVVPISGIYRVTSNEEDRLSAEPGSAVFIPAGTGHQPDHHLDPSVVCYACMWHAPTPTWARFARVEDCHSRLLFLATWMSQLSDGVERGPPLPAMLEGPMQRLVGLISDELAAAMDRSDGSDTGGIGHLCEHIQGNLAEQNRIDQLAARIGAGERQLSRRFRAATGSSPYRYIQNARIERAIALLIGTELTVGAIAHSVGYSSVGHFSNLLYRRTGRRPTDFRRTRRGSAPLRHGRG